MVSQVALFLNLNLFGPTVVIDPTSRLYSPLHKFNDSEGVNHLSTILTHTRMDSIMLCTAMEYIAIVSANNLMLAF